VKHDNDDLSAYARRGELDEAAEKQLLRLLGSSEEARLVHDAGREFDREDAAFPDDPALADRIVERVFAARPRPRPAPAKRPWLKTALGGGAVIAAMAAAGPLLERVGDESSSPSEAAAPSAPPVAKPSAAAAPPPRASAASPLESPPPPRPGLSTHAPGRAPRAEARAVPSASTTPIPTNESASDLFARANQARRGGNTSDAIGLYQRLQQQFPASAEALSAAIALGMLELKANRLSGALSQFETYLARAPGGSLAPEALWGRAQALSGLGRRSASEESLRLLLKRYPKSAYADAARAKLESPP
jgi:TolA-binding protein